MDPCLQDYLGGLMQCGKPKPDLYRLWAKYFSSMGCPKHVVHKPNDWPPFFIMMLFSPSHFEWAKNFPGSKTWTIMLNCSNNSSMMAFALPSVCLEKINFTCKQLEEQMDCTLVISEDIPHPQGDHSSPPSYGRTIPHLKLKPL